MKKIKITFLLTILFALGICTHSFARITTNDPTVNSGGTVTITINSGEPVASGAINLTSNEGLTFKSASGGTANGTLVAFSKSNNATSGIATYTFTAPTVTEDKKFKLVFSSQDMADENGNPVNSSSATATVTVKGTGSGNNNSGGSNTSSGGTSQNKPKAGTVTSCYINTVKVNEFLNVKNKDSVPVKVNTSTNEGLTIYNNKTKKSYKAKSGATTNVQIVEGEQTLTITLDTGYKTTRKVVSIKEGEEVKPNVMDENPEEEEVKVILKSLVIKGVTIVQLEGEEEPKEHKVSLELSPKFSSEVYEYSVTIPEELNDITKLDITALGDRDDFTIEINGNEDLVYGENIVTIIVKTKDGEKKQEYKIIVNKEEKAVEAVTTPMPIVEQPKEEEKFPSQLVKNIIIIVTLVALVAGIVFAVVEYKYTNRGSSEYSFGNESYGTIEFEEEVNENEEEFEERENMYRDEEDDDERRIRRKGKHF